MDSKKSPEGPNWTPNGPPNGTQTAKNGLLDGLLGRLRKKCRKVTETVPPGPPKSDVSYKRGIDFHFFARPPKITPNDLQKSSFWAPVGPISAPKALQNGVQKKPENGGLKSAPGSPNDPKIVPKMD